MAFFPPLLETALLYGAKLSFSLGRFDLRWFKILRCWSAPRHVITSLPEDGPSLSHAPGPRHLRWRRLSYCRWQYHLSPLSRHLASGML